MNELLKKLLAKVGIDVPEDGELTQEQQTAALSAIDALKIKADLPSRYKRKWRNFLRVMALI